MEAAKIGPDLRFPIIILVCPPEILHNFFKFSWVEIEDNAYAKFRGGKQGLLWEMCNWRSTIFFGIWRF